MATQQNDESLFSWLDIQIERFVKLFVASERPGFLTIVVGWGIIVIIHQLLASTGVEPWQNNLKNLAGPSDLDTDSWISAGLTFMLWPVGVFALKLAAFLFQLKPPPLPTVLRVTGKLWMLQFFTFIAFDFTTVMLASMGWGTFAKLWHGLGEICALLVGIIGVAAIQITYRVSGKQLLPFTCLICALFIMVIFAMVAIVLMLLPSSA